MMRCTPATHEALRSDPAASRTPAGLMRDLVDDEEPPRADTYELFNVRCACGAVFTCARLVASVLVSAEWIAAEHAALTA